MSSATIERWGQQGFRRSTAEFEEAVGFRQIDVNALATTLSFHFGEVGAFVPVGLRVVKE
jgi:hypothetical protein